MRFITKLSFLAVIAIAAVNAKEDAEERAFPAGAEDEEFQVLSSKRGGSYETHNYDGFGSMGRFDDDDYFGGGYDNDYYSDRRRHRCHRCGFNPCRCHNRRSDDDYRDSFRDGAVEERNEGRLKITAPQCNQEFSICSTQSICWSGPGLAAAGYKSVLGFYVGGRSCKPIDGESRQLAVEARDICNGRISEKNIIFLGQSDVMDGGYLNFNIPYCISEGFYQPVLFAFKREGRKIKYIVSAGPWIKFIRNLGGKIESNLKRVD